MAHFPRENGYGKKVKEKSSVISESRHSLAKTKYNKLWPHPPPPPQWVLSLLGCSQNKTKKISVQTETNRNKICFSCVSVCFMKPKQKVLVFWINIETTETNRTFSKLDWSAETSFGSSFGCFEWKLVSKDTLLSTFLPNLWIQKCHRLKEIIYVMGVHHQKCNSWTTIWQKTRVFCSMLFTVPTKLADFKETILYSDFKKYIQINPGNKKSRVYSWTSFCRTEKWRRKLRIILPIFSWQQPPMTCKFGMGWNKIK